MQTKKRMLCGLGVKGLSFTLRLFHLWNTPRATFANRLFEGIPFIVGVAGGLPNGCGISGCAVIFLDKQLRNLYEIHVHMNCWICFVRVIHAGFAVLRVNSLPMWMILFCFMRIQCYCWWKKYCTSWYGKDLNIYRGSYMLGGCLGFLNHQQYVVLIHNFHDWLALSREWGNDSPS